MSLMEDLMEEDLKICFLGINIKQKDFKICIFLELILVVFLIMF